MIVIKQYIKKYFKKLLLLQGYRLSRVNVADAIPKNPSTMESAFQRLAKRGHSFNTVIDIGASNGKWSLALSKHVPPCEYLLVEAQPVHEEALRKFKSEHKNTHIVFAAAGETSGQIYFDASDPFGGQASYTPYLSNNIVVPVTTIDNEIRLRKLPAPYLLKLDTHGFEIPILNGALETLTQTEVIIIECYNFRIAPQCLLFYEMCEHLDKFGFRCIDLVDVLHRRYDDSLWQMDMFFVKDTRPEFQYLRYK